MGRSTRVPPSSPGAVKVQRERDLYHRLLQLSTLDDIDPLLLESLALMVDVSSADQGYFELREGSSSGRRWISHGLSTEEVKDICGSISQGIIADALNTGQTIVTPAALFDPRFSERSSVRTARIGAVLCAPIGNPPFGVVYLERRRAEPFGQEDLSLVELCSRRLAAVANRILTNSNRLALEDPTRPMREVLRLHSLVGRSTALAALCRQVALVAPLEVSVLLTGESGTGKTLVARTIHQNGPRAREVFVELNCAALPEVLVESELFGALPGAHSTAVRRIPGKVESAEHGTLFLDEVSDLSLSAQGKLLQLLQAKQYYPLGGTRPLVADVRIIAATNINIAQAVTEGRFRADLFYRLSVMPIRVPSLSERREDIAILATYFCETASKVHSLPSLHLSPSCLRALEHAEWPGNVRQLGHTIEAASIRASGAGAKLVEIHHVFPESEDTDSSTASFQQATRRFQAEFLRKVLADTDWDIIEAARRLGVDRSHVYRMISAFGLDRDRR